MSATAKLKAAIGRPKRSNRQERIPEGTLLLLEACDRLSRPPVVAQLALLTELWSQRIRIVIFITSVDEKADQIVFVRKNNPGEMALALSAVSKAAQDHPRPKLFT